MAEEQGFDPSMIQSIMSIAHGGTAPPRSGVQNYVPRNVLSAFNAPYQGFSFMQALGPLGPLMGSLGLGGDIFSQISGIGDRLQANWAVDPLMLMQQRQMQRATMGISMGINAQSMSDSLGISLGAAKTMSSMMPFLGMVDPRLPGMINEFISPNAIGAEGARSMVQGAMLMDPMGRLRDGRLQAMQEVSDEMEKSGKYSNGTFLHGMTRNEFQDARLFAIDQGLEDTGMDRRAVREDYRRQLLGGRNEADLSEAEQRDLNVRAQAKTDARAYENAASYNADINRSVRQLMPGISGGEAFQVMSEFGLGAGTKDQAGTITKLLQELEALSSAAGMSAQQMLNAGRSLQSQFGGDPIFHAQVAAMAQATERFAGRELHDRGINASPEMSAVNVMEAAEHAASFQGSAFEGKLQQAYAIATTAQRAEIGSYIAHAASGDAKPLQAYVQSLLMGSGGMGEATAGMALDPERANAYRVMMRNEYGSNYAKAARHLMAEEARRPFEGTRELALYDRPDSGKVIQAMRGGASADKAVAGTSFTASEAQYMFKQFNDEGDPYSNGNILLSHKADQEVEAQVEAEVKEATARRDRTNTIHDKARSAGAGAGIPTALLDGKIKSGKDLLVAAGYMENDEIAGEIDSLSQKDKDYYFAAMEKRNTAMKALRRGGLSEDEKAEQKKNLGEAVDQLDEILPEKDKEALGYLGRDPESMKATIQDMSSAMDKFIEGLSGLVGKMDTIIGKDKPAEGTKATDKPTVNAADQLRESTVKVIVELLHNGGQPMPKSDYTVKAAEAQGTRDKVTK